jgi:5-methylcytosine-specific restriction endonuclease McrA
MGNAPSESSTKYCPRCKTVKGATEFSRNKSRKSGLADYCRQCMKSATAASIAKKPDEYAAKGRERAQRRYQADPEARREQSRQYRRTHHESFIQRKRERYAAHRAEMLDAARIYREKHGAAHNQRKRERYAADVDGARAYHREKYWGARSRYLAKRQRARSKQAGVEGTYTAEQWDALCLFYSPDGLCLACTQPCQLTIDHVIPLSMGGKNQVGNLQCLCLGCNSRKGRQHHDYRPDRGAFARQLGLQEVCHGN